MQTTVSKQRSSGKTSEIFRFTQGNSESALTERLRFVISRFLGRQGVWKSPGPEFPYEKVKVFLSGLNHGFGLLNGVENEMPLN